MKTRILPIVKKEFRQVRRDPRSLWLLVGMPAMMLFLYGYALTFDVRHLSLAVLDRDRSARSREFLEGVLRSEYFDLNYRPDRPTEIDRLMDAGKIAAALVIPDDFSAKLSRGEIVSVQVLLDGSNANTAITALGYFTSIVQEYSTKIATHARARPGRAASFLPVDYRPRIWYNPELKSVKFLVPGLIGLIMMITAVIATSLSIVREKERGTMEQIMVSPVRSYELIVGKVVPYICIAFATTGLVLLIGVLLFDVTVKGNPWLLFAASFLFLTGALGIGLVVSTVAETQQVAFMMAMLISLLPTMILSGFIFPIRSMPTPIRMITYLIPARYYMVVLRAILLKGVGLSAFWEQFVFLFAFAAVMLGIGSARMKRQMA